MKCPYDLEKDTVDGLVNELQKAIDLNEEESKIVKVKLNESISKYISSQSFSLRNSVTTMSSFSSEQIKQKSKYDEFISQFNSLSSQVKIFLESETVSKLNSFSSNSTSTSLPSDIQFLLEDYKQKEKNLKKLIPNTFKQV